jgi:hypothetical protein
VGRSLSSPKGRKVEEKTRILAGPVKFGWHREEKEMKNYLNKLFISRNKFLIWIDGFKIYL